MKEERFALVNGQIILPDRIVRDKALYIRGGIIQGLEDPAELGPAVRRIDVEGRYIVPGLIDIHIHGAMGHTFNEPSAEAFQVITAENARNGVTSLLATVATAPIEEMTASFAFAREWMRQERPGTQVLGMHSEGPYFNPVRAGAQDPANLRMPDDGSADGLLAYADVLRIFTFAPELPGAIELTRRLTALGIVPAAGHSNAREEDVIPVIEAGLRHIIHIWSGQSTTVKEGPWRKPGLLEVSLTREDLTVEMICDNRHLPPTLMKLAYKCIGPDRLCIVSDATSGAGLPEGSRFRMGKIEYEVHDGVGMMLDRSSFAGSTTLLNQMIPVLTEIVGVPLPEAIRMASLNPARVIGIADRKGSLEPGKDADIAIFNDDFTAWRALIRGRWV
jgi:N-acetylglucosamine-6-phosphate deacetylase